MGELRRIVCQKKYLLAVFVLLIANLFLFQYYQMDNLQALRDKETRQDTIDVWQEEQETAKEEFVSKIKEMDAQSETLSEISIFSDENSLSNFKANLSANPLKVMTYLNTPIERDLAPEEIEAYQSLVTYDRTTIVENDAECYTKITYMAKGN